MTIGKTRVVINLNIFPEWFEGLVFSAICGLYVWFCFTYEWTLTDWLSSHGLPNWANMLVGLADFCAIMTCSMMAIVGAIVSLIFAIAAPAFSEKERQETRYMIRWGFLNLGLPGMYFWVLAIYCAIVCAVLYGLYRGVRKRPNLVSYQPA